MDDAQIGPLATIAKPTQIYRYLRNRHLISPIFLHRTLSYMKHRMSRSHKARKNFKVDSIYVRVAAKNDDDNTSERKIQNLSIACVGVFSKNFDNKMRANLELSLVKFCHKKRNDPHSPVSSVTIGSCEIPINPNDQAPTPVTLTVPKEFFSLSNGQLVKYYSLHFKITATKSFVNGETKSDDSDTPSFKKRKVSHSEEFTRELTVIDRNHKCVLTNGEYQIVLVEASQETNTSQVNNQVNNHKVSSWESVSRAQDNSAVVFEKGPVLVFHLMWTDNPGKLLLLNLPLSCPNNENNSLLYNGGTQNQLLKKNGLKTCSSSSSVSNLDLIEKNTKASGKITYRFLHGEVVLQQTKSSQDLKCPWCSLKCKVVMSLMHHLKNCHMRFNFSLIPDPKGYKINVTVNENFDGSYAGNPYDLSHPTIGHAFSKKGPVRRSPVTQLIYLKPKKLSLPQFVKTDDPDGIISIRPYIRGHNRQYYQSTDCFPIKPQEIDEDSEAEIDPEWMRIKTQLMIDEFTDVNEGEKEVMKLWNLHGMKHGYVGDCQIPAACEKFVDQYWQEIFNRGLYKNFILHLNNLFDFGILPATHMRSVIKRLNQYRKQIIKKQESNK